MGYFVVSFGLEMFLDIVTGKFGAFTSNLPRDAVVRSVDFVKMDGDTEAVEVVYFSEEWPEADNNVYFDGEFYTAPGDRTYQAREYLVGLTERILADGMGN